MKIFIPNSQANVSKSQQQPLKNEVTHLYLPWSKMSDDQVFDVFFKEKIAISQLEKEILDLFNAKLKNI